MVRSTKLKGVLNVVVAGMAGMYGNGKDLRETAGKSRELDLDRIWFMC